MFDGNADNLWPSVCDFGYENSRPCGRARPATTWQSAPWRSFLPTTDAVDSPRPLSNAWELPTRLPSRCFLMSPFCADLPDRGCLTDLRHETGKFKCQV